MTARSRERLRRTAGTEELAHDPSASQTASAAIQDAAAAPPRPWLVDAAFWTVVAALLVTYAVVHADSPAFVLRWAVKLARAVALGEAPGADG